MAEDLKFKWDAYTGRFVNRVSGEAIPHDEPVILFRARDGYAVKVLEYYLSLVQDPHHQRAVSRMLGLFDAFREMHPDRMKEPGITHDVELPEPTTYCSDCSLRQISSPSGITCPNGHGGAEGMEQPHKVVLSGGPVAIIDERGVHPSSLDRAVDEQREYYRRNQPDPRKRGFTPK